MNPCDGGHDTDGEIRRLPLGGGAGVFVCRRCYAAEADRSGRTDAPRWEDLPVALLSDEEVKCIEAFAGAAAVAGDWQQVGLCHLAIHGVCLAALSEEAERKRRNR